MKQLVFTPDRNTKRSDGTTRSDYTGAFKPESVLYETHHGGMGDSVALHRIDVSKSDRRRLEAVQQIIASSAPMDRLVMMCHGWETGVQMGLSLNEMRTMRGFVDLLIAVSSERLQVALYCCLTGASKTSKNGDGGFAATLRDLLYAGGRKDITVFSHSTKGHTTRNASVRLFVGGARGGVDVAKRGSREFKRLYERLHDKPDSLRWRIPYMTLDEIRAEIA